ncbi:MAG: PAS domain-containing protein [Chloroflexi bacterium]|nr:PAS domain-containing protein [Chloroflexota bacterium]
MNDQQKRKPVLQGPQPVEQLLDHLPILIAYIDEDQRYLYVNQAYAAWYGKEKSYFIGQKIADILTPDVYANVQPNIQRVMTGETFSFENISYTSAGEERTVLATYVPYIDAHGEVHSFLGMVQDITARKRATAERERMLAAERAQRELAETFIEITNALNTIHEREEVLQTILVQLARVIPYDSASVMLISDDQFQIVTEKGFPPDYTDPGFPFAITKLPHIQEVLRERHPVIIQDTHTAPRWYANPEITYIRCWMGTPLIVRDRVIGLLNLDKKEPNFYTQRHAELSAAFANQAAIAIENARLYEQARRDARTKSMLLKEVNHRVGNNLTAILGLLLAERRHAHQSQRPAVEATLDRLIRRIEGLSEAHRMLSCAQWAPLYLSYLATKIIHLALNSRPTTQHIAVEVKASARMTIMPPQAMPLALIINELATNTIKYAMDERQQGKITLTIDAQREGDEEYIAMVYRDDGPGYPPGVLNANAYHIGLTLLQRLVRISLKGQLSLTNREGAVTTIRFPVGKQPPWTEEAEAEAEAGREENHQ